MNIALSILSAAASAEAAGTAEAYSGPWETSIMLFTLLLRR